MVVIYIIYDMEEIMGFFSNLLGNGEFVTKIVAGKLSNVGKKKMQTIQQIESEGYMLVNEVVETGGTTGFFDSPAARYTLTFQKRSNS